MKKDLKVDTSKLQVNKLRMPMNIQFFATTKLEDVFDPEVLTAMISAQLDNAIRFSPLAVVDDTLVGRPGSTLTVPAWKYIGDAEDVLEGEEIEVAKLEHSKEEFTIKKAGKGVELTDESVLSGYGDPEGEASQQLLMSIANKIDNDSLSALQTGKLVSNTENVNVDAIDKAQSVFNDEDQETMVLFAHPKDAAKLRADAAQQWTRGSELGDQILVSGVFGEILGAQVVRSRKLKEGIMLLVKPGAFGILRKRTAMVERDRDIKRKTTLATADQHYGVHLRDDSKVVRIQVGGTTPPEDNDGEDTP